MLRRIGWTLALLALLLTAAACAPAAEPAAEEPMTVVPNFVGLTYDFVIDDPEIMAIYRFEAVGVASEEPSGTVLKQHPAAGKHVAEGTTVTLTVAE